MVFDPRNTQEESTQTVDIKGFAEKYDGYMKDHLSLGKVKMTDAKTGYKRFVAESTFNMVSDLPTFEENPEDGVWKDSFMGQDGNMRYVVYFMKNADIEKAMRTAVKIGLPSYRELNEKMESLAEIFG